MSDIALNLFGTRDEIRLRMADEIRHGLENKVKEIEEGIRLHNAKLLKESANQTLFAMAKYLGVAPEKLGRIYDGAALEDDVNYKFFHFLERHLDISIHDALGDPNFRNSDTKKHWLKRCQTAPILRAAALASEDAEPDKSDISQPFIDKELEMYVAIRAIEELMRE